MIEYIKKFFFPLKEEKLINFYKDGSGWFVNTRLLRQTEGYKRSMEQARILAKELNLKTWNGYD